MSYLLKSINVLGVISAVWFTLTSWIWTYWGALYIAYPFGLLSLLIFLFCPEIFAKKLIKIILIIGLIISLLALILYR